MLLHITQTRKPGSKRMHGGLLQVPHQPQNDGWIDVRVGGRLNFSRYLQRERGYLTTVFTWSNMGRLHILHDLLNQ